MEGRVVQKVDCRPVVSKNYMQLKKTQMIEAARPKRITQQLDSAVRTVFKPISKHKEEVFLKTYAFIFDLFAASLCEKTFDSLSANLLCFYLFCFSPESHPGYCGNSSVIWKFEFIRKGYHKIIARI